MDLSQNTSKYDAILRTAKDLFWKHGIKKVSIEEICREAGVSKMTFYRMFPNKIELAKMILKNSFDESYAKYRKLMDCDISFEEKIKGQVLAKFQGTQNISAELIKDIYADKQLGLHEYLETRISEFYKEVRKDFAHAQQMGWMRKDINLDFILYFSNKMAELTIDPNLILMYNSAQDLIMELTNLFFYGILPKPGESGR
jgi:AcrR family transcriptional regulator